MKKSVFLIASCLLFIAACANEHPKTEISKEKNVESAIPQHRTEKMTQEPNTIKSSKLEEVVNEEPKLQLVNEKTIIKEEEHLEVKTIQEEKTDKLIIEKEAIASPVKEENANQVSNKPSHSSFNKLLSDYVSASGEVRYTAMKAKKTILVNYIKSLTSSTPKKDWSKNEKLAYWINLYNAATLNIILDNHPITSITKINGGKPWDLKLVTVDGKTYSLNEIENNIVRPRFNEPRIHFALNCAAKSCPKLLNSAFIPSQLNAQLTKQTKAFLSNTSKNTIGESTVEVSKIFEWYAADFGNLITFINKYSSQKVNSNAQISYKEYSWSLNGK